ncbi:MAG: acyl-CoA dehydratase activase-related protein [Pseudomonadota bacterium]
MATPSSERFVGIDVGAETIKVVELAREGSGLVVVRRLATDHRKEPGQTLVRALAEWDWDGVTAAAVSGRLSRQVNLPRIPTKQAQATGFRFFHDAEPATVVSIGSHGFSVLELRDKDKGVEVFRENSRCSQGTGNFLRQLVERFDLTVEAASAICADVADPAPLSGRCPVILKTDMTHLANKGESRARILAGLYDAVCENVQVLIKPKLTPPRVALIGGASRARRIREHFRRFLAKHGMTLLPATKGDAPAPAPTPAPAPAGAEMDLESDVVFFEAVGCAVLAAEHPAWIPSLDGLVLAAGDAPLDQVPALASYLPMVKRMPPLPPSPIIETENDAARTLVLGFDIGSTGSKVVALDIQTKQVVWEGYLRTNGNPVGAAQALMQQFVDGPASSSAATGTEAAGARGGGVTSLQPSANNQQPRIQSICSPVSSTEMQAWAPRRRPVVAAIGVTGSGREIVGSLLSTCYGKNAVFVLNEIAAHAEGALHYDPRVDTIFEIGGQDAKYIRLVEGRVVDAAMNEACSAGTGSFIEEQGRRFSGIADVAQLGGEALASPMGVSLGQHCSVFMAEIIDEAVASGVDQRAIIAGIYDSIVQNYLNRVKGSRSVGSVIFCQGMPFSADALAAAVVRQTGSEVVIPPNPGTVGALGIALLTCRDLLTARDAPTVAVAVTGNACSTLPRPNAGAGQDTVFGSSSTTTSTAARTNTNTSASISASASATTSATTVSLTDYRAAAALDVRRFLEAKVERKDTFVCKATVGCGGSGNKCRIDRIFTVVEGQRQRFTWGGGCALYDKGTRKRKLPDRAPDPFREREELAKEIVAKVAAAAQPGSKSILMTDEFQLKSLFPFFATFLAELGLEVRVRSGAGHEALKRGIEEANIPFCAPMQQYHGLVSEMADERPDYLFLPMLRELPRVADEQTAVLCPIVQASTDMIRLDLGSERNARIVSPVIDAGAGNLESAEFVESCRRLARELGRLHKHHDERFERAYRTALSAQTRFDSQCLELGRKALRFCAKEDILPVVVLGRAYTIYNNVLNSNVPAILREQGVLAIPVDCYPIAEGTPVFYDMFWGYGQRNLRAAHQIRRASGIYSVYCSNYSCGPDSFSLHFYSYVMEGKPFAIIETDGHSGDAGTKTRIEAFLHCVREDVAARPQRRRPSSFKAIEVDKEGLEEIRRREEIVLIPRMGPGAEALAACLRGLGIPAESLPMPDREAVQLGRRHTSGKECIPMCITMGSLLARLERDRDSDARFAFFMPSARGPCRFGVYNLLHKIVLERLGWKDRVRIWSPVSSDYFDDIPAGFVSLVFSGFMASDLLLEALYDVRPVESRKGAAEEIHRRYYQKLIELLEQRGKGDLSTSASLTEVASGRLFGCTELLGQAAREFAAVKLDKTLPTVIVVGEIYVRCDPFANDFVIKKLEERGIRCRFAAFYEWLEYMDHINLVEGTQSGFAARFNNYLQNRITDVTYRAIGSTLGWPKRTTVEDTLAAAAPYLRHELVGEAVLTVGGPIHEHREGVIDGVVSVGPLECMPNKISEAQFFHAAEKEGLLSLTLALNGDPVDPEVVDNFAFEVHARHAKRQQQTKQQTKQPTTRTAAMQPPLYSRFHGVAEALRESLPPAKISAASVLRCSRALRDALVPSLSPTRAPSPATTTRPAMRVPLPIIVEEQRSPAGLEAAADDRAVPDARESQQSPCSPSPCSSCSPQQVPTMAPFVFPDSPSSSSPSPDPRQPAPE